MRALEDALAIVHASESDHPHPLLTSTKDHEHEMQEQPILKPIAEEKAAPVSLTDALGTLYLDSQGVSRFFGPTGGSEVRRSSRNLNLPSDLWNFRVC